MTQDYKHLIAPPSELVEQWYDAIHNKSTAWKQQLATSAAQWGADQELEACLNWLTDRERFPVGHEAIEELKADRRPKPPSLKEQALDILNDAHRGDLSDDEMATIRRALEQLPDHE